MSNRVRARHRNIPQEPLPLAWPEPASNTPAARRCRSCGTRRPSSPSLYCAQCEQHKNAAAEVRGQAEQAQQLLNEILRRFHLKVRAAALGPAASRAARFASRPRNTPIPDRTSGGGPRRA
ncbi:hypothetical protein [Streptomyces mirabilis]|uniref:hypothetical protein n=1 Tax=Streptomyces mirabilis TaxID=68239 RepID=UPI0033FF1BF7